MITIVGVGTLGTRVLARLPKSEHVQIIDYDIVEDKNLRRQYPPAAVGMRKVDAARAFIREDIDIVHKHLDWSTAGLLHDSEIVLDCTDNMLARYVINDYCHKHGIPWIHAGLSDTLGSVAMILPDGPCYQCIYPRGAGEDCTTELSLAIADKVADTIMMELLRSRSAPHPRFIRITTARPVNLDVSFREGCPTCNGEYHYLSPHDYYITFCNTVNCMSAKPVHPKHHDWGESFEGTLFGVPYEVFENGEIHFYESANDDVLHRIADAVYAERFRGKERTEEKEE